MARYEKLTKRRCRLRATIRSGTSIPGPLSAINNRSTSTEREKDRMRNYLPFLSRREKRVGGGVLVDGPKQTIIRAYHRSRSSRIISGVERKKRKSEREAGIQMDDAWRTIRNMIEALLASCARREW